MKITIIGGGNGGLTAAYWIAKNGHQVMLADDPKFNTQIKAIANNDNEIDALKTYHDIPMLSKGKAKLFGTTTDFAKALKFSEMIIIICPTFAQEIFFKKMLPFLNNNHILVHLPGNYASLSLNKIKNDMGYEKLKLTFVDGISFPFATRIVDLAKITILGSKTHLPISVWPNKNATRISKILSDIFQMPFPVLPNPLVAGLENINFGGHPLMTVCNMALLENFEGKFNYYKDCCSPATANACNQMDQERLSVGKAFGWKLKSELDAMNDLYNDNKKSVYDFNRASVTHEKLHSAPKSSHNRYVTEDVPYLLVPCFFLAQKAGVELPVVRSIITIAGAYNQVDYFKEGLNLEKLGLAKLSKEEIKKLFI